MKILLDPNKPIVHLGMLSGLGIIISYETGVQFRAQCGGVSCTQNTLEGFYYPLEFEQDYSPKDTFYYKISKYICDKYGEHCFHGIDEADADYLDSILNSYPFSSYYDLNIRVDRSSLKESMESWIKVKVTVMDTKYSDFKNIKIDYGYLVWPNSD